jgi:hypothetical protein
MLMSRMSIAVVMQRRTLNNRWIDHVWAATAAIPDPGTLPPVQKLSKSEKEESYLVPGLMLELYPDEDEGYFENWAAPEPKIFIMWRMQDERAMPVAASVSYAEGTRMLDSGENADGVPMPPDVHAWLGSYLRQHYRPRPRHRA